MQATMTPTASPEQLRAAYVGKTLDEVATPAAVLDVAKVRVNCARMLEATASLGLLWRAHTKTHKASLIPHLLTLG